MEARNDGRGKDPFMTRHALVLFSTVWMSCALLAADAQKPNIVFILADDLGWTDTGVYGSLYYETPNIDRLAAQGVRFTNHHHCQNCTPTRAALMSGQVGPRTGVYTVGSTARFDTSITTPSMPP
jgi:arylsulfatase A-like enzyme